MNRHDQFKAPFISAPRTVGPGHALATGWDEAILNGTDTHGNPATVQLTRAMYDPTTVRASLMATCPKDRRQAVLSGVPKGKIDTCFIKAWAQIFAEGKQ